MCQGPEEKGSKLCLKSDKDPRINQRERLQLVDVQEELRFETRQGIVKLSKILGH